jgi:hypothetical protein
MSSDMKTINDSDISRVLLKLLFIKELVHRTFVPEGYTIKELLGSIDTMNWLEIDTDDAIKELVWVSGQNEYDILKLFSTYEGVYQVREDLENPLLLSLLKVYPDSYNCITLGIRYLVHELDYDEVVTFENSRLLDHIRKVSNRLA